MSRFSLGFTGRTLADPAFVNDDYVKLLLHGDGTDNSKNIFDSSGTLKGVAPGIGTNTVIRTTQKKFGTGALFFPGANDIVWYAHHIDWEFGAGDFTIDWQEFRSATANSYCVAARDYSTTYVPWLIHSVSGRCVFYCTSNGSAWDIASNFDMGPLTAGTWTHRAICRQGSTWRFFQDGVLQGSFVNAAAIMANTNPLAIGFAQNAAIQFSGHIDEFRISKGISRWNANFSPPSAPYPDYVPAANENDPNTLLLLHMEGPLNGTTFTDSSMYYRPVTRNGAAVTHNTSWYKFGNASLYNNGTANCCVTVPDSNDFNFGANPFTIDFWMHSGVDSPICGQGYFSSGSDYQIGWIIANGGDGGLRIQVGTGPQNVAIDLFTTSKNYYNAQPHHVALVRNGNVFTIYKDGVADGSVTAAITMMNSTMPIAIGKTTTTGTIFNGFIDEFRISNVARWTANFTPPTSPYPSAPPYVPPVTPGSTTYDSGSGNFTVPAYATLTVEAWGAGAGGDTSDTDGIKGNPQHATAGGNSLVSTLSMSAGGGQPNSGGTSNTVATLGAGGTALGGNTTNTNGSSGGADTNSVGGGATQTGGIGAACPLGGAAVGGPAQAAANGETAANAGNAPGGGSSGSAAGHSSSASARGYAGGASGAYVRSVYTAGVGAAPAVGALLAYSVGAGGINANNVYARAGAAGRVKFTWS